MKQVTLSSIVISALLAASTAFSASGANTNKGRLVAQNTRAVAQVKRADAAPGATTTVTPEASSANPEKSKISEMEDFFGKRVSGKERSAYEFCKSVGNPSTQITTPNGTLSNNALECLRRQTIADMNGCGDHYKKAVEAATAYKRSCREAKAGDPVQCMKTAAQCATEEEDATTKDLESTNNLLKSLDIEVNETKSEVKATCARYSRKDYDTKQSDISSKLREAQKDLEASQKERAKAAEEYSSNKRKQVERQSKVQEQMSKLVDSNQKEAQERAQEMSKGIIETEKEQASARVQNIKAQGEIAKIQGLRANDLSKLTDAMISTNCMAKMDLLLKQWALEGKQSVHGAAALFQSNTEKKRRIQDEHRACIEQLTSTRKQLRKQYAAEVQAVKEQIKSNDKQAASLEEQKSRQASDYQAFLARQGASTQEAYTRANAELAAIGQENAEIEKIRVDRSGEALKNIADAQRRVDALSTAMSNIGVEPRGTKLPGDAIIHMDEFMENLSVIEGMPECAALVPNLKRVVTEGLLKEYNNFVKKSSGSDSNDSSKSNKSNAK
jgi:hypothetical protein